MKRIILLTTITLTANIVNGQWKQTNGLNDREINCIVTDDANIFAGTYGGGVWIRPLNETLSINEIKIDNDYLMFYPNPNSGKFKMKIHSKATNKINIEIYSLAREKIFEKTNFNLQASNEIDLSNFPSSIYFLKIYDRQKIYMKKLVIQ